MKRFILAAFIALIGLAPLATPAEARDHISVGIGLGGGGYYGPRGYYPYYSPYYYGGYPYYAPSVVYAEPPTVVYQDVQPPVTYVQPQPQPQTYYAPPQTSEAPVPVAAPQQAVQQGPSHSPTYKDDKGRTCRDFQSVIEGDTITGKACLQPDGSWRTVE